MPAGSNPPVRIAGKVAKLIFFGNYFYGICAIALAVESSLQQRYPLNGPLFYILLFTVTVLYYSKAYLVTEVSKDVTNIRSAWYMHNRRAIIRSLLLLLALFIITGAALLWRLRNEVAGMRWHEWSLLLLFPFVSVLYYGVSHRGRAYNIRRIGWLKPFVIGFTWAGLVSVYPILFSDLSHGTHYRPGVGAAFLFVKNFMFISLLCIMFDIKDYVMDYNMQIKTFVVKLGPTRTIWLIIIPLALLGLASFLAYASLNGFEAGRILINTLPFILIMIVGAALRRQRSIFYYLVIIDGLMLLKAGCGIAGMLWL